MGNFTSRVHIKLSKPRINVLMFGLSGSGKSTILHTLQIGVVLEESLPTGWSTETLRHRTVQFRALSPSEGLSLDAIRKEYLRAANAVVFVVDAHDIRRLQEASQSLRTLLAEPELIGVPMLIYATKQDLSGSTKPKGIIKALELEGMHGRAWHVQGISAGNREALFEGLEWLEEKLRKA